MSAEKWPDVYEMYGIFNDDSYLVQLLKEFHFLTNEKKEQTHSGAGVAAFGDETVEPF